MSEKQNYAGFRTMTDEEVTDWFQQEHDWAGIPPMDLKVGILRAIRIMIERSYQ